LNVNWGILSIEKSGERKMIVAFLVVRIDAGALNFTSVAHEIRLLWIIFEPTIKGLKVSADLADHQMSDLKSNTCVFLSNS